MSRKRQDTRGKILVPSRTDCALTEECQAVFDNTKKAMVIVEEDTTISLVNVEFERLSGYAKEEIVGKKHWTEFVLKDDLGRIREYHRLRSSDPMLAPRSFEFRFIDRQEGVKNILLTIGMVPGTKKSMASMVDITDRKRAEQELRDGEERYRALFEGSRDAIYITTREGTIVDVNQAMVDLFGSTREGMIGASAQRMYADPADRTRFQQEIERTGSVRDFGVKLRRKDGAEMECLLTASVRRADDGGVIGYQGIIRDMTERKRADEALKVEKAYLEGLFESAREAIVMADKGGRVVRVNSEFTNLFGYTQDEAVGCLVDDLIVPEDLFEQAVAITRHVGQGEEMQFEAVRRRKDGTMIDVSVLTSPIIVGDAQVGVYGIYRDITDRRQTEEALQRAHDELEGRVQERTVELTKTNEDLMEEIIDRKLAEESLKGLSQENAIIAEIGRIISSTLNIEEVYERFVVEVRKLFPIDRISINTFNAEERTLTMAYVFGVEVTDRKQGDVFPSIDAFFEEIVDKRSSIFIQPQDERELAERYPILLSTFRAGFRSMISVPLISKDQVIGAFHLRSLQPKAYTELDLRLAERVGSQIAGAIANAQLFTERTRAEEALRHSEEINQVLFSISNAVNTTRDLDELYRSIHQSLGKVIDTTNFFIALYDKKRDSIAFPYHVDEKDTVEDYYKSSMGHVSESGSLIAEVIESGKPFFFKKNDMLRRARKLKKQVVGTPSELWLGVPLKVRNEVIGAMVVQSYSDSHRYGEKEAEILNSVSDQVALAIDRKQAEEDQRRNREKIEQLHGIATKMEAAQAEDEVYNLTMEAASKILIFEQASIQYVEDDFLKIAVTTEFDVPEDYKMSIYEGLGGKTYRTGKSYNVGDVTKDSDAKPSDNKYRSVLSSPIGHFGVFQATSYNIDEFTEEDLKLTELLMSHVMEALKRIQSEKKIRESEERYRALFESSKDSIFITTREGRLEDINQSYLELFGYKKEELVEISARDTYVNPDDRLRFQQAIETKGSVRDFEVRLRTKDGKEMDCLKTATVRRDAGGNIIGYQGVIRDITERKRAEERLQRYAAELEKSNEEVKNFAYIVSHDLRSPLVNLKGFAGELRDAVKTADAILKAALPHLDEGQQQAVTTALHGDIPESLGFIETSVTQMDKFINAVLMLSRLGRRVLKPELLDMGVIVQTTLKTLASQIEQGGVQVMVDSLPSVTADRTSMEQVMGNILGNAAKYLEPGRSGRIEISGERNHQETIFSIRDNGRGIAAEDMGKVFAPFRRAGRQDTPGEGMGLAYVQTMVRRHGGRIWCESELGKGTTFVFTLPNQSVERGSRVEDR